MMFLFVIYMGAGMDGKSAFRNMGVQGISFIENVLADKQSHYDWHVWEWKHQLCTVWDLWGEGKRVF